MSRAGAQSNLQGNPRASMGRTKVLPADRHDRPVPKSVLLVHPPEHPACLELARLAALTCGGETLEDQTADGWVYLLVDGRQLGAVWVGDVARSDAWVQGNAARLAQVLRDSGFGGLTHPQIGKLRIRQGLGPRYRPHHRRSVEERHELLDPAIVEEASAPEMSEGFDPSSNGEHVP